MKSKCYEYRLNFVGEREGKEKKSWELDSIKFPNNFVLKKSNNLFKSNKTTNFNKKTYFKPTCLCIILYNSYDTHLCIGRFM